MFPGPGYLCSKDGVVWLCHSLVNLYIWLTISSCYGSILLTLGLMGRDGDLSTLCHSCRFACQQTVLKTFPGSGYLHLEDGVVWLWHSMVNLYYIYIYIYIYYIYIYIYIYIIYIYIFVNCTVWIFPWNTLMIDWLIDLSLIIPGNSTSFLINLWNFCVLLVFSILEIPCPQHLPVPVWIFSEIAHWYLL